MLQSIAKKCYIFTSFTFFDYFILLFLSLLLEICSNLEFYGGKHWKKTGSYTIFSPRCSVLFCSFQSASLYSWLWLLLLTPWNFKLLWKSIKVEWSESYSLFVFYFHIFFGLFHLLLLNCFRICWKL